MKRTLFGILTLGLLALAIAANGQPSKHHAAKSARTIVAAGAQTCTDPSKCPYGCRPKAAASAASAGTFTGPPIQAAAEICNGMDPSKCPAGCRKAAAGATAERIASR